MFPPRNYLKATLILAIYCFFPTSLQVSEIIHHALDNKIDLVMIGNEVRTKGKHQLLISCTQKKGNLPLSNTKNFYSLCEPWHTWWESVDILLLIKCSTYKAMWQNVFCKFCLLKAAGQDIWSDCEDLFLFLLPWTERNCWQLLRGALVGAGCGMRNWSKGKKRERLSANTSRLFDWISPVAGSYEEAE